MPRRGAVLLGLTAVLAIVSAAAPQDGPPADGIPTYHWPHRVFNIPVDVARISRQDPKPTHLQLYHALGRGGQWQRGAKLPLGGLKDLDDGKKGFEFTADKDGEYEFTVQYVYGDGTTSPKNDELTPQIRIVIDTTPPTVRLFATGNGVEWSASDENLDTRDPKAVTLECRWAKGGNWQRVTDRPFRTTDRYAWQLRPGEVLEVRVLVKDRAGHEGVSPVVRVPGDGATGTGLARDGWPPRNPTDPLTRPGAEAAGSVPQPSIYYVNTLKFDVEYTIHKMGRSGVRAAHLFVIREQGTWLPAAGSPFAVNMTPSTKEQTLSLPYEAKEEGLYGFFVIPESGAGRRAPDPMKADQPMVLVEVDTKPPFAKVRGVRVTPGARNPLVEITWEAQDRNLMPRPVSLEYSVDRDAQKWQEIKYQLDNNLTKDTGRYVWEVPDDYPWKFWVRIRAVDKAANTATEVWPEPVIVDTEVPTAGVQKVRGGKDGAPNPGGASQPPPSVPNPPTPPAGGGQPPPDPKLPELPPKPGEPGA